MKTYTVSSEQFKAIKTIVNVCDKREALGVSKFDLDGQENRAGSFYIRLAYKLMFELRIGKSIAWNTECVYNRFKKGMLVEPQPIGKPKKLHFN
jgi:hypothetical protein